MEYKATPITVDQPFIEQSAFRDFLKLPSEEPIAEIRIHDLLEVAKLIVRNELASCGCSANELIGFHLEYQVPKGEGQGLREIYSVEWSQVPSSEQVAENKISEEQPEIKQKENFPVSPEFIGKLTERLDEAIRVSAGSSLKTFTRINSTLGRYISCRLDCDGTCGGNKRKYCKDENGNEQDMGCTKIPCERPSIEPSI